MAVIAEMTGFILSHGLIQPGEKVLLAVSGGIDSVVMEEMFFRSDHIYGIAHCNFRLRGAESDRDEDFVRSLARRHAKPFFSADFDTAGFARMKKISVQMAARDLRYAWFNELMDTEGFDLVATAHQQDDQVETFLINLARGTGLAGLHGIPVKSGRIIRPMLFTSRDRIRSFAENERIEYRHDRSNDTVKYHRNRIRLKVIPQLEKINPSFKAEILRTISRIGDMESIYRQAVTSRLSGLLVPDGTGFRIALADLALLSPKKTWMYELLSPFGFNDAIVSSIINSMPDGTGKKFYSTTHRLVIDRTHLLLEPWDQQVVLKTEIVLEGRTGEIHFPLQLSWSETDVVPKAIPDDDNSAFLDADRVSFPLTLRRWEAGDFFYPLGLNGRKKISDYFIDKKIPVTEKERIWLLCSGGDIVWVVGKRIDHRYRITGNTSRILKFTLHPPADPPV